jgi:hypothetical protein
MGCCGAKVKPLKTKTISEPKPLITVLDSDKPPSYPNSIHLTDFSEMYEVTVIIKRNKTKETIE